MAYKFEKLDVWQRSLEYADLIYGIAGKLPPDEKYNLKSQITRAENSIALNIAEGSTGLSDREQAQFIRIATRSLVETVACIHLIKRRGYFEDVEPLREVYRFSETLFAQLQAFRSALSGKEGKVREDGISYRTSVPF